MTYIREEQETIYNFDPIDEVWHIYSTYPPHIRRIMERADVATTVKNDDGRIIEVHAKAAPGQIRIYFEK